MTIGERLRSRVLRLDQRWIDLALAGTVAVWFVVELLTRDPQGTDRLATGATGLVVIAALLYTVGRRTDGWTTVLLCVLLYGATSAALSLSEDEALPAELLWGLGLCA